MIIETAPSQTQKDLLLFYDHVRLAIDGKDKKIWKVSGEKPMAEEKKPVVQAKTIGNFNEITESFGTCLSMLMSLVQDTLTKQDEKILGIVANLETKLNENKKQMDEIAMSTNIIKSFLSSLKSTVSKENL